MDTIREIVEKRLVGDGGYKTIHIGVPHKVINSQFIYKSDVERLIKELEAFHQSKQSVPSGVISQVSIKPECREKFGFDDAWELAQSRLKVYYGMFASEVNKDKTFKLQLTVDKSHLEQQEENMFKCKLHIIHENNTNDEYNGVLITTAKDEVVFHVKSHLDQQDGGGSEK